jgi:hypothetical protein
MILSHSISLSQTISFLSSDVSFALKLFTLSQSRETVRLLKSSTLDDKSIFNTNVVIDQASNLI